MHMADKEYYKIYIDPDVHRHFKALCAIKSSSISVEIEKLMQKQVMQHERRKTRNNT